MGKYILFLSIILIGAVGQTLLKLGIGQSSLPEINSLKSAFYAFWDLSKNYYIISVFFLYILGLPLYFFALSKFELSYLYPLVSAVYIVILLSSWLLLKEDISSLRIIGTIIIAIGIFLVAKS